MIAALFASVAPSAWGQVGSAGSGLSEQKKADAKAAFELGKTAYNLQKYHSAAAHFAKSYELSGNADLLFNIAQAYRLAGANDQAIAAYKSFLREVPTSPNRTLAESKLEELQIAQLRPPSKIKQAGSANVAPTSGTSEDMFSTSTKMEAPEQRGSWSRPDWLLWAGAGTTGALAVGAIATGVSARSTFDSLKSSCGETAVGCTDDQIDGLNGKARWANVLWVLTGLAAVGTGVVVYLDYTEQQGVFSVAGRF